MTVISFLGLMDSELATPSNLFINALRLGVFAVEYCITSSTDFRDRH